jgi:hypothetical protein
MPYSATPPKPAIARSPRSSRRLGDILHRGKGMARAVGRHAGLLDGQRLDLQAVDADHRVPSFIR